MAAPYALVKLEETVKEGGKGSREVLLLLLAAGQKVRHHLDQLHEVRLRRRSFMNLLPSRGYTRKGTFNL